MTVVLAWKLIEADEFDDLPSHRQNTRLGQASGLLCTSLQNLVIDPEFRNQVFIAESRWPPPPSPEAKELVLQAFGDDNLQRLADLFERAGWHWPVSAAKWLDGLRAHPTLHWLAETPHGRPPLRAEFLPQLTALQKELCRLSAEFREAVQADRTTTHIRERLKTLLRKTMNTTMAAGLFIGLSVDVPELYDNIVSPATMLVCTQRVIENRDETFECREVVRPDGGAELRPPPDYDLRRSTERDDTTQRGPRVTPASRATTVNRSPAELMRDRDRNRNAGNRPNPDR